MFPRDHTQVIHGINECETRLIVGVEETIMILVQRWPVVAPRAIRRIHIIILDLLEREMQSVFVSQVP